MAPTIIHSVLLFDGKDVQPNATVVFDPSTGLITSVSGQAPSNIQGATVIDGQGHTLLPGLIDSHIHLHGLHLPPGTDEAQILRAPLFSGVTTILDMHSDLESVNKWRNKVAQELAQAKSTGGTVSYPEIKTALLGATITGGWPKPVVLGHNPTEALQEYVKTWPNITVDNAQDFVKQHRADGADYIKLMQENCCSLAMPTGSIPVATLELQTAVVKAAKAEGFPVVGHALSVDMTEIVLQSGADGLTHTFVDQPPPDSIIDLYKKTNAFVIPTLTVVSSLTSEEPEYREKFSDIAFKRGLIDEFTRQNMLNTLAMKSPDAKIEYAFQSVRRLKQAGIDIVAGTDAAPGLPGAAIGPSLWQELEMYVDKCGLTIPEALTTATATPARRFGFHDRGVVAQGKRADLVLVKGDVTQDLQNFYQGEGIVGVWKEGLKAARST